MAAGACGSCAPVLLIEIVPPSNAAQTGADVWACATIPSVADILLAPTSRIGAELVRRCALPTSIPG